MNNQMLEEILERIHLLEKGIEPHIILGIDYKTWAIIIPLIAVILSLLIALFGTWISERWKRRFRRSKLVITSRKVYPQDNYYVGRLTIKNISKARAINVEAYVESIYYNGNMVDNYLPIPLQWTHGQIYKSRIIRDLSGNQTVYLDVFHYNFHDKDRLILHSPIHKYTKQYSTLEPGTTELHIKLYQESGQVLPPTKVTISWEEGKIPEFI